MYPQNLSVLGFVEDALPKEHIRRTDFYVNLTFPTPRYSGEKKKGHPPYHVLAKIYSSMNLTDSHPKYIRVCIEKG